MTGAKPMRLTPMRDASRKSSKKERSPGLTATFVLVTTFS